MKKLIIASTVLIGILVACGKKMTPASTPAGTDTPTVQVTEKSAEEKDKQAQQQAVASTAQASSPTVPNKPSEAEAGITVYNGKCTKCHAPKPVSNYTYSQWEGIMKKMVPNARLTADEETLVMAYVKANAKQ